MIYAKSINKEKIKNRIRLSCEFFLFKERKELWFEIDEEFSEWVDENNGDPFLMILWLIALENDLDLKLDFSVSHELLFGINTTLSELLKPFNPQDRAISIFVTSNRFRYENAKETVTAMSMGVDSFHTLSANVGTLKPITALTLFNAGSFGAGGEVTNRYFDKMLLQVTEVSTELGLPLLWVDSNLGELLSLSFLKTHTFRHFACAAIFQTRIKDYFYSSGHKYEDFQVNLSDSANYDLISSLALKTNSMNFQVFGMGSSRLQKTKELVDYNPSKTYLNVCLITDEYDSVNENELGIKNCSKCYKCIRTMIMLELLGHLEDYKNIFDLESYYSNKSKYYANIYYHYFRSRNVFSKEIIKEIRKAGIKMPQGFHISFINRVLEAIIGKVLK
ncbi:hypothetical protein [Vibrio sp. 10N.222.49.C12]|uniref:hypothetical protein n=1 Tax=Vibrio sp. 10N.222.49.C12 TaxID=3229614 RepID=UPI003552898B